LQDIFPEIAASLRVGGFGGLRGYIARRLRNGSLQSATMNVAIGGRMGERLEALGISRDRIAIIPNWADGEAIRPLAHADNSLRHEWGLAGKFVVMYSGNLGRAHEFATLLAAVDHLRNEPDIVFVFVGGGHQLVTLEAEAKLRGLTSVRCMPYQARERLRESLGVADVHWISLRPELEGLIVPSKIYGVLAEGRPVLMVGDPDGVIGRLLRRNDCGMTVCVGEGATMASAALGLRDAPDEREAMGRRARLAFDVHYSMEQAFGAWRRLIAQLTE
jgi:glycosyltransferase involved in cell wall biosynthesis